MKSIRFLMFVFALLSFGTFLYASESSSMNETKGEPYNFSFTAQSDGYYGMVQEIQRTRSNESSSNEQKSKNFLGMGIAGAVIMGIGFLMSVSGIVLVAVGYTTFASSALSFSISGLGTGAALIIGGAVLLAFGMIFLLVVGLPLCIVGFVLSSVFKKKTRTSFLYNDEDMAYQLGFSIRL